MAQVRKSTQGFELFGGASNPGAVRVSTENSIVKVILGRCAIVRPATTLFRLNIPRRISRIIEGHAQP